MNLQFKRNYPIILLTLLALLLAACGGAITPVEEPASAVKDTAVAEIVSATQTAVALAERRPAETPTVVATLTSDYDNAVPILMQLIVGVYQLEGTDQAVIPAQATSLLPLLTSLKDASADNTITQEQIDLSVVQAVSVLTPEQIQAIAAMKITQETTASAMESLGIAMGGPQPGDGNAPTGQMGQPPQGGMPQGTHPAGVPGASGQPPNADQIGTPPADGIQRGAGFIPLELIDAIINFLQGKITS